MNRAGWIMIAMIGCGGGGQEGTGKNWDLTDPLSEDPPIAVDLALTTDEDTPLDVRLTADGALGFPLLYVVDSMPEHGALTGSVPDLIYTPDPDYAGEDTFTFTAAAGDDVSLPGFVDIVVHPVNDWPAAISRTLATDEDVDLALELTAFDPDGDSLTFEITSPPENGVITGTSPLLMYEPNDHFFGTDQLIFTASDGEFDSAAATLTIHVAPINDAPQVPAFADLVEEDGHVDFLLLATDADEDPLTWMVTVPPDHGILTGIAPSLGYTPDLDYFGADGFTFTVSDGIETVTAVATLTVTAENDLPSFPSAAVDEDSGPVTLVLPSIDADGELQTWVLNTPSAHAAVDTSDPLNWLYTPNQDWWGTDNLEVTVTDTAGSTPGLVVVTVNPAQDAPLLPTEPFAGTEDTDLVITLDAVDVDEEALTWTPTSDPVHGSLILDESHEWRYIPDPDQFGVDSFEVEVDDGVEVVAGTLTIDVAGTPDDPVAIAGEVTVDEDNPAFFTLSATDPDLETPTFTWEYTQPAVGTVVGVAPDLVWSGPVDHDQDESILFRAESEGDWSELAPFAIHITPLTDAPVAHYQAVEITEDDPGTGITLTASDADGDPLTWEVDVTGLDGELSGVPPNLTYVPDANYEGSTEFQFRVNDGEQDSPYALVAITVLADNDPPTVQDIDVIVNEDAQNVVFMLDATDVDNSSQDLSYQFIGAVDGTIAGADADLDYTPVPNSEASESIGYRAFDGEDWSNIATVTFTILPENDPPTADNHLYDLQEDALPMPFTLTGSDLEDSPLVFQWGAWEGAGVIEGSAPDFTYTPAPNWSGVESWSYTVNDGELTSDPAEIRFTVAAVNDDPELSPVSYSQDGLAPFEIELQVSDVDSSVFSFFLTSSPTIGSAQVNGSTLQFTPTTYGTTTFGYSVADDAGGTGASTITIDLSQENQPPTAIFGLGPLKTAGNTTVHLPAPGILAFLSDPDGDLLSITPINSGTPEGGFVTMTAEGAVTYTPPPNARDTTFMLDYSVTDGQAWEAGTVQVDVSGMVWYVESGASPDEADGRDVSPFASLADVLDDPVSLGVVARDTIYVMHGDGAPVSNGGHSLPEDLILAGAGVEVPVPEDAPVLIIEPDVRPVVDISGFMAGLGSTIKGLEFTSSYVDVTGNLGGVGETITIQDCVFTGYGVTSTGGNAIVIERSDFRSAITPPIWLLMHSSVEINDVTLEAPVSIAIDLESVPSVSLNTVTISGPTDTGLQIGDFDDVTLNDVSVSALNGISLYGVSTLDNASVQITNPILTGTGPGTGGTGLFVLFDDGDPPALVLDGGIIRQFDDVGVYIESATQADSTAPTSVVIANTTLTENTDMGVYLKSSGSDYVAFNVNSLIIDDIGTDAIKLNASGTATLTGLVANNQVTNGGADGLVLYSQDTGSITALVDLNTFGTPAGQALGDGVNINNAGIGRIDATLTNNVMFTESPGISAVQCSDCGEAWYGNLLGLIVKDNDFGPGGFVAYDAGAVYDIWLGIDPLDDRFVIDGQPLDGTDAGALQLLGNRSNGEDPVVSIGATMVYVSEFAIPAPGIIPPLP